MSANDLICIALIVVLIGFTIWTIYWAHFQRWNCSECGKQHRGYLGKDGFEYGPVGPCCVWETISHAQYNRMFGIKNNPKRIK